jgi:fumarylpyruvate hydrolase
MLSRAVTLAPGDLIYTGTPAGVGPLQPGDAVSGGVADIGRFSMTVGGAQAPDRGVFNPSRSLP